MQLNSNRDLLERASFLTGDADFVLNVASVPSLPPFTEGIINFLNEVSGILMRNKDSKSFSDVITFAFWIRRASMTELKDSFNFGESIILGRGIAFHIAPSNVPCNFAYSLVAGLIMGNANIVRVPSKDFAQVKIIIDAINAALEIFPEYKPYIILIRYGHDREINNIFSGLADVRIVWGGDATISELRQFPMQARSVEISFADRYSLAVINSDYYCGVDDKNRVAEDFYNDTYFTDQNACTSPRIVIWTGSRISEAKEEFWGRLHQIVEKKYYFQGIQGVNKLTSSALAAVAQPGIKIKPRNDNLVFRVSVSELTSELIEYKENSGFFFEYDCKDILELKALCNDKRCQTIAYLGDKKDLNPLLESGIKGIDRVVPLGKTMDFDLIWDGYKLPSYLTRTITVE